MTDEKCATRITAQALLGEPEAESPPAETRPMYLIVIGGGIPGAMIRLSASGDRIGRAGENTVRVDDPSVSRRHARIVTDPRGVAWITDLGSTNGTYLNHQRLTPNVPYRLEDGDRLRLGSAFVVKYVGLDPCDERFQRELFERSVRDALTGLYNRAYFLDRLGPIAVAGAARGLGLAVLMLDIDHFKRINDTHGHDAGDAVLREVAGVLRESTRTEDLVARYGGEEFVLAVPVAAPDQATERAERVRAAIAERHVGLVGSAAPLRVTASLGLTFARPGRAPTAPLSALITAADKALYQAKSTGRNRVIFRGETATQAADSEHLTPRTFGD